MLPMQISSYDTTFLIQHSLIHSSSMSIKEYDCLPCTHTLLVIWDIMVKRMDLVLKHMVPTAEWGRQTCNQVIMKRCHKCLR